MCLYARKPLKNDIFEGYVCAELLCKFCSLHSKDVEFSPFSYSQPTGSHLRRGDTWWVRM